MIDEINHEFFKITGHSENDSLIRRRITDGKLLSKISLGATIESQTLLEPGKIIAFFLKRKEYPQLKIIDTKTGEIKFFKRLNASHVDLRGKNHVSTDGKLIYVFYPYRGDQMMLDILDFEGRSKKQLFFKTTSFCEYCLMMDIKFE